MTPIGAVVFFVQFLIFLFAYRQFGDRWPTVREFYVGVSLLLLPLGLQKGFFAVSDLAKPGSFGGMIFLDVSLLFVFVYAVFYRHIKIYLKDLRYVVTLFVVVLLFALLGVYLWGSKTGLVPVQIVLVSGIFAAMISGSFSTSSVFAILYSTLFSSLAFQAFLSLMYPVIGIDWFTKIFSTAAIEWATRRGSRDPSAVGTFSHPGHLGLYATLLLSFFLACWSVREKTKLSMVGVLLSAGIVYLTGSRTSLLAAGLVAFATYLYTKIDSNTGWPKLPRSFIYILFASLGAIMISFPLVQNYAENSDIDGQMYNRGSHFQMALASFMEHPFSGVGLNNHLAYFEERNFPMFDRDDDAFFYENPIHSIHFIVLSETGALGFFAWVSVILYFLNDARLISMRSPRAKLLGSWIGGFVAAIIIYGSSGWGPFSRTLSPFLLAYLLIALFVANREAHVEDTA